MKEDSSTYITLEVDKLQKNSLRLYEYLAENVPLIKEAGNKIPLKLLVAHYMSDSRSLRFTKRLLERELETVRNIYQGDYSPEEKAMALLVPDVPDDNGNSVRIHQWRLKYKETELKDARDLIVEDILGCDGMEFESFEGLYEQVRQSILKINFIGPLTVYDVAKRLWYALGHDVQGTEQAWVVAGARDGLVGLVGKEKAKGLLRGKCCSNTVYIDDLPDEFKCMDALYIEDFLCVMHPILTSNKMVL